jgi:hypothetical protein
MRYELSDFEWAAIKPFLGYRCRTMVFSDSESVDFNAPSGARQNDETR